MKKVKKTLSFVLAVVLLVTACLADGVGAFAGLMGSIEDTSVTKIDIANQALRFYLSDNDYGTTVPNNTSAAGVTDYNYWEKVQIYTDEDTSKTLQEAYTNRANPGNTTHYNLWTAWGTYAVSLDQDSLDNAKKVVIPAGTQFPSYAYTTGASSTKKAYVTTEETIFINKNGTWEKYIAPTQVDTEVTALGIVNNGFKFTLSENDYGTSNPNNASADSYTAVYNYMGKIVVYTDDTTSYKLKDIFTQGTHHNFYNLWIDWGTFTVQTDTTVLNAATKVVIPAGTEFPSYAYTTGATSTKKAYVTTKDAIFLKNGSAWEQQVIENTEVTKIDFANQALRFKLSQNDYGNTIDKANNTSAATVTSYNYWDKVLIYTSDTTSKTLKQAYANKAHSGNTTFYNLWTDWGTYAVSLDQDSLDNAKKVVIPAGTEFPSYQYTTGATTVKKAYATTEDVTYVKSGGEWTKTAGSGGSISELTSTPANGETVNLLQGGIYDFVTNYQKAASGQYCTKSDCYAPAGVTFSWSQVSGATEYILEISTSDSMIAPKTYKSAANTLEVDDLEAGKTYFYRIKVKDGEDYKASSVFTFKTAQLPRTITIDGVSNTRDLGGYLTTDGKYRVRQGIVYRGANLEGITAEGKQEFLEKYAIKTDLDIRGDKTRSPLGNAVNFVSVTGPQYIQIADEQFKDALATEIRTFADPSNYPIYFHCQIGRDRTGTLAMLINALLGVSEEDIYKDYELSMFSQAGWADNTPVEDLVNRHFYEAVEYIKGYQSGTLQENAEAFVKNELGITRAEIDAIRDIMLEEAGEVSSYDTDISKIQVRGGKLIVFPEDMDYASAEHTTQLADKLDDYNILKSIVLYKSETEKATLQEVYGGHTWYNVWDTDHSIAFDLTDGWDGTTIKKVEFLSGTSLPAYQYTNGSDTVKSAFVLRQETIFTTDTSADVNTDWTVEDNSVPERTSVSGIKSGHNAQIVTFYLTHTDYDGLATEPIDAKQKDYNYLKKIKVYSDETNHVTLKEAYKDDGQKYYNMRGEANTFSISLKDEYFASASRIVIPAGTVFPSSKYTNGTAAKKSGFVLKEEMIFEKPASGNDWSIVDTSEADDTTVTKLLSGHNASILTFYLSASDYEAASDPTRWKVGANHTDYNYLDKIRLYTDENNYKTLKEAYKENGQILYNMWSRPNTFSIELNAELYADIIKVFIPEGTVFPAYAHTNNGEAYKYGYVTKKDNTFGKPGNAVEGGEGYQWNSLNPAINYDTVVSRIQVRDESGKLFLFLNNHDYAEAGSNVRIGTQLEAGNILEKIEVYRKDGVVKKLSELYTGEGYYNLWGEQGCIALDLVDGWDGTNVEKVVILADCEFPSYAYTSGAVYDKTFYKTKYETIFKATTYPEIGWDNIAFAQSMPKQIVNVIAIGEIGKVSLSWGESSEVNTDSYNIYRKASDESNFRCIKTVNGRDNLSYEDTAVEKGKTYFYYVTGVGLYGAESIPSEFASATVQTDKQAPTILKVSPAAASVITGKTTLSATATDNIGVTKIAYFYTLDNGENWVAIGETTNKAFSIVFDTSDLGSESVKVKAVAYDAEGNESNPITVVYSLDNVGPEKVTGLSAVTLSSKITLSWNDVTDKDAAYFILQTKSGEEWTTVAKKITTLGYTITGLQPDTDYIYRVACVDTHGNIGEYSDEFTARTAVDETAPVITSQSPNSARYNSTIKFSVTAKDDCDVEIIEIQVSTDLSSWITISTNTYTARTYKQTYTYTIDLSSYAEGSIFVRAIATDFSGNISDTSESAPYTEYIVDKTAPEAPTGVSANGNDGYITVSWTMGSEADLGKYFVYKSTSLDGNYQLVASNLSSLNYHDRDVQSGREFYYKVKVSDTCGNMSEYSNAASATMSPDTQKPEITSISSTYQQKISSNTHTINVAATDNNKLSKIVVEYCTSTNPEYAQLVIEENIDNHYKSISVTLPIDGLADGEVVHLRAYAVDMAGLQSGYATAKYTLDTTPPMVEDYSALLDVSTVYLDWKDNGESDLSGFKVYRSVNGEAFTLLGSRGISSTGSYSFIDTITDKESNTYIYKLESIDRLGNTSSWLKSVDYTYVYVNQIPIAQMSIPDFMTVGVEEIFDASGSTDDIVIMSYLWDFGDGTTSTEMKPVKSYDAVGTYSVKLSVTDNEGITSTITKDIEVKERDLLGTLNVKVVDDNGKSLSYVPVYFDLGSDNQKIIYTNASGVATLQMLSGTHTIGMYASGYLPVKKDVVVLANATRTVTLTTVEEDIVTGNFEITRMTFDEIVAAGIDVYDPANQNVYSATVRVTYGSTPPLTIHYVRNDDKIISYTIKDSNGNPVTQYTNSNGENRKITGITYIPSSQGDSDVVAIMDIPAEASYLKEFFDVRLHIVNNASSEFALEMNEIVLNVPEGMTLMTSVSGDYSSSNTVKIDAIKGQETVTFAWVLRGDKAGEYDLSADFTGTLAEFNELVTARFETEEPIKVYGLEGVKFRILTADEIHNDTLYFNIELENERDIDIYIPSIGLTDKIQNVTESVLHNNAEDDFFSEAYILNAYIQTENGQKQYVPVTYDANGRAITDIETLAPGQKIVYEYVAYNAINYDGIAYFKEAAITEFKGVIDNIETGSFHKEQYSFTDYSAKLDDILSGSDADVGAAFDYIKTDDNYYYWAEAVDKENGALAALYAACDVLFNADLTHFTNEEKKELIRTTLLSILSESSIVEQANDLVMAKYNQAVSDMIDLVKTGTIEKYTSDELSAADIASAFEDITKNSKTLAITYRTKGSEAFKAELSNMIAKSAIGLTIDASVMIEFGDEAEIFSKGFGTAKKTITALLNAAEESEREAYYYSVLKLQCNAEISNHILDSIIAASQNNYEYSDMINDIAVDLKTQLNSNMEEYYKNINYAVNLIEEAGMAVAKVAISAIMKKMIGSTPLAIVSAGFNILDSVFGFGDYYKQQDSMCIYNALTISFVDSFRDSVKMRNLDDDYYSMLFLRAVCELRFSGEKQYKSFMQDYINGIYGKPLNETQVIEKINGIFETSYTTTDEWWDNVQYNIVHSRDILFNVEGIPELETPRAPVVTLDYDKLQTVQSFTPEYEYCFADGVWRDCSNEPITFEVGVTPSVLRVRKAASDANFVGEITTVKIFARKDLSKLITAKFDGVNYLLDNLSAKYNYQVIFTNDLEATVDWSAAQTIAGSDSTVKISGVGEYSNIIIRSCQNADLYETTSNPLSLTVSKKKPLNLVIDGSGTVVQTADSGSYFNSESIDLIATANTGCSFIGWYIDDVCVSTDEHYIVEMADDLKIVAQFTGVKIKGISIEKLPTKLNYYEGESLDLNGMKVLVTYSDNTTAYAEQFAAHLSSNAVGKSTVVITYGGYSTSYDVTISHNESVWITTVNATMFNEGLKVKRCSACHKVVATEVLPMLVDESGIIVDTNENLIYNIPEYLFNSDAVITHYGDLGCRVKILDATSKKSTRIMTGGYVMYAGKKYTSIIFGDTNGDGEIDIFDILGMLDHVNCDTELKGVYKKAGLIVNEEEIDIFDTLAVLDHVNGDVSINQ